jgi:hypothetical protein
VSVEIEFSKIIFFFGSMVLGKKLNSPFPCVLRHSYGKRRLENNGTSRDGLLLLQPAKNEKATRGFLG